MPKVVSKGWITTEDAVEIIGGENPADVVKAAKLKEISEQCNAVIVSGIDIELGEETEHFNLSIEDQSNIANLFRVVELGGTEFPYQADGSKCRIYTAQEIAQIYIAVQTAITTQTTYHNALKAYVQSLTSVDKISAVTYGMTLPQKYRDEMDAKLSVAQAQMEAIVSRLGGYPMCKIYGHIARWVFGGFLYGGLEILWRGYTHWTMILLAALLCIPLDVVNEHIPWEMPLVEQAVLGGTVITLYEFVAGCIINLQLGLGVWDYSNLPFNLLGQVCLLYWALWCLLAGPVIVVFDWLEYRICGGERPHYTLV